MAQLAPRGSHLIRFLLYAAFAAALLPMSLNVFRKVQTFGRADILVSEEESGYRIRFVGESAALRTRLVPGDFLLSVDGRDAKTVGDPSAYLATHGADLTVYRGTSLLRIRTTPSPAPSARYVFLLFCGAVFFASGLSALRRPSHGEELLFGAFALTVSLVLVLTPAPPFDGFYRLVTLLEDVSRILFPALLVKLVFTFPRRARLMRTSYVVVPAAALLGLTAFTYLSAHASDAAAIASIQRLDRLQGAWMVVAALLSATRLLALSRRTIDLLAEKQVRFLLFGTLIGLLPLCLLDLLPRLLGGSIPILSSLSLLPLALLPLAFLAALTRYRLWDVETLGRETTALLGAVLLGAGFFTAAQLLLAQPLPSQLPYAKEILQTSAGLLLALSFMPVRRRLTVALEKLQYQDLWKERESLLSIVRELSAPRRLAEIETLLVERISKGLGVFPAALLFVDAKGLVDARHVDGGEPLSLDELPPEVRERAARLSRRSFTSRPTTAVARLRRAGFRTLAPLAASGRLLAFCAVGDRLGRAPLSRDDMDLLETVLASGALALDHARLYEELAAQADRYRTLKEFHEDVVAGSAAAIAATDETGRFTSVNAVFSALTGKSADELRAARDVDVFPPSILASSGACRVEATFAGGPRILDLAISPFPGAPSGSRARVYVCHDVTETVRMERALADHDRLAALSSLSAGMAHEVNTPLTGVASFARLLLDETPESDPRRGLVEKIEKQAFRASRLVSSLLDLARGTPRDMAFLDAVEVAREAIRSLEDEAAARGVTLRTTAPAASLRLAGHGDALVQVLVNLLKNAIDAAAMNASPSGSAAMTASPSVLLALRNDGGRVSFDVIDNGPGLAPNESARVFEPFYSTKKAQGGTGLGLAIARDIIQAHGGTMSVDSAPGRGSRFTVSLPVTS